MPLLHATSHVRKSETSRTVVLAPLLILLLALPSAGLPQESQDRVSPLGQTPGRTPSLFAPGIVASGHLEHSSPTFSPAGDEVYWSAFLFSLPPEVILFSRAEGRGWTAPEVAPFSGHYSDGAPAFSTDGSRLYFSSNRPMGGTRERPEGPKDWDIWYVDRLADASWGEPTNLGPPVNTAENEGNPSLTTEGTLYYEGFDETRPYQLAIYRARPAQSGFQAPEMLDDTINSRESYEWCPFVDPQERYLLFSSERSDSRGRGDLYLSIKAEDGSWGEPVNLESGIAEGINGPANERFPRVSRDGKWLFFVSNRRTQKEYVTDGLQRETALDTLLRPGNGWDDVYWVRAEVILDLLAAGK